MRAGAYTEIVDIYKVHVERNEFGEQHDTYTLSERTRANVVDGASDRTDAATCSFVTFSLLKVSSRLTAIKSLIYQLCYHFKVVIYF